MPVINGYSQFNRRMDGLPVSSFCPEDLHYTKPFLRDGKYHLGVYNDLFFNYLGSQKNHEVMALPTTKQTWDSLNWEEFQANFGINLEVCYDHCESDELFFEIERDPADVLAYYEEVLGEEAMKVQNIFEEFRSLYKAGRLHFIE